MWQCPRVQGVSGHKSTICEVISVEKPEESSLARAAYDLFGLGYVQTYPDDLAKFAPLIDQFLVKVPAGGRILDVGCGNGAYVAYFLARGFDAIGIDISETMLSQARRMVPLERLFLMDMFDIETFPAGSFDAIVSITSMLYTGKRNHPEMLRQIHRLLKPGGRLFLMMLEGVGEGLEKEEYLGKEAIAHAAYYLSEELEQLVLSCGFQISQVTLTKLVVLFRREITVVASKPELNQR
jgi:cyclopropane fatty-acyl-phospholipid synthase-like methyltransferase